MEVEPALVYPCFASIQRADGLTNGTFLRIGATDDESPALLEAPAVHDYTGVTLLAEAITAQGTKFYHARVNTKVSGWVHWRNVKPCAKNGRGSRRSATVQNKDAAAPILPCPRQAGKKSTRCTPERGPVRAPSPAMALKKKKELLQLTTTCSYSENIVLESDEDADEDLEEADHYSLHDTPSTQHSDSDGDHDSDGYSPGLVALLRDC